MATFRKSAIALGVTMSAIFASNAFAIGSKADCEYEGGTTFEIRGDLVCVVQIRPEEFRDDEAYDGQQLGINTCEGEEINEGNFCKITLVKAKPKPKLSPEEAGLGLKVGDVVNEKGEKVTDALPSANTKKAAKVVKKAAEEKTED